MHIKPLCVEGIVLTWRPSSAHDRLRRRIQMQLESTLTSLSAQQQEILPIAGEGNSDGLSEEEVLLVVGSCWEDTVSVRSSLC